MTEPNVVLPKSNIEIKYNFTQNIECVSMRIEIIFLTLFTNCQFRVSLYDKLDNFVKSYIFMLEGDEYLAWNNDDQYIIDWIKSKLPIP